MKDVAKKKMLIVILLGCIVLAILITLLNHSDGENKHKTPIQLLCTNQKCGYTFVSNADELRKLLPPGETIVAASSVFKCPKCDKQSAYMAVKCKKCGALFVVDYKNPDTFDKCPKCGFSSFQEQSSKSK
jgi:hypothetical protein